MAETQRRPVPRLVGDELETAMAFLDFQREAMVIKCEGLVEHQLREVRVPTGTTLLGLVQHLTVAERYWLAHTMADEMAEMADDDWDFGMEVPASASPAQVIADYEAAVARSNEIVRRIGDLDQLTAHPVHGQRLPLRWVLAHLTTETARHVGHADILREQIDGATGR